jgi:hypothetical protein
LERFESVPPFRKELSYFGEYISNVISSPDYASQHYLQSVRIEKYLPNLMIEAGIEPDGPCALSNYLKSEFCNGPTLFIGAKGTRTSLHYERTHQQRHVSVAASSRCRSDSKNDEKDSGNSSSSSRSSSFTSRSFLKFPTAFAGGSSTSSQISNNSTHSSTSSASFSSRLPALFTGAPSSASSTSSSPPSSSSRKQYPPPPPPSFFSSPSDALTTDPGKHSLFLLLSGVRKFTLFPPSFHDDLLPSKHTPWPHVSKSATFIHMIYDHSTNFDFQMQFIRSSAFPSIAKAWPKRIEVILQAGETLFIPARWWHCTQILASGTGVNWWFYVNQQLDEKILESLKEHDGKEVDWESIDDKCVIS